MPIVFDLNKCFLSELEGTKIGSSHPSLIDAQKSGHDTR